MQIHRNEYNGAADKPNFKKASYNLPYMNSVVPWAIGSLWAPLRKQREFAFGDSALFAKDTRDRLGRIDACGQRHDRMLIPMFFPSSAQEQDAYNDANTDGHLVLVLAKKTPDESDVVELELYNSLPGWFKDNRRRKNNRRDKDNRKDEDKPIAREAGTILRLSNWMGRKGEVETPSDRRYNFILTPIDVPTQKSWRHTCGLHTILAGWALLLGIPLHEHLDRRKPSMEEEEFVDKGKEIVDLAIAGFMDSTTIQAFLQASGMVVAQDASDEAVRVVHVGTMVMSDDLLKAVVLEDKGYDEVWWVMQ